MLFFFPRACLVFPALQVILPLLLPPLPTSAIPAEFDVTLNSRVPISHPAPTVPIKKAKVLILGGGLTGIIAARTLHQAGITDFIIVEARTELGGRMQSVPFGRSPFPRVQVEQGPNWIQGTQTPGGNANPIFELAKKHGLKSRFNDWFESLSTYNASGPADFLDVFGQSEDDYERLTVLAGTRVDKGLVDTSARTGYSLGGAKPATPHARASEYYQFDWEYAQTPDQSSLIASSWGNNYTYDVTSGGFSDDNQMSIDQRGFKTIAQTEATEFLAPSGRQVWLGATVRTVKHSREGVQVVLADGRELSADYALCTFSLGVLQHDDVIFEPKLPDFKQEAIQSMVMATYTKIFLQFPHKFWFDTEMAIYADEQRGRYTVWQSLDHSGFLPGSGIIFVTVTGDFAIRIETLSNAQVQEEVLSVLRAMFPSVLVPEPTDFYFPRWHANPLFRGSYSNWPPSFASQHLDNLRANIGRLYFAGEATSRKYFGASLRFGGLVCIVEVT
ncbi:unnamed protein product [Cyclocybe aegerita]|uniref:Amine oxidase n=1 Tax=Cyclocybe aegerita TaxID=1973307 RepID=A0A8S0W4V7_CYCAE|nr:unnamed protein product [Cyclocybe aegerita]